MLEGADGDVLIRYGHRAFFHLSADRRVLRCAPTERDDPIWQRVLLDTVLWTASLLRGYELLHASAVQTDGRGGRLPRGAAEAARRAWRRSTCGAGGAVLRRHPGPRRLRRRRHGRSRARRS